MAVDVRVAAGSRPDLDNSAPAGGTTHRTDIEGLRAVAVLMVMIYHAGLPLLPGGFVGVDVFFVISGFLITGLLLREAEATGRVDLVRFYARRIRRLLPAATLVLIATAAAVLALLPDLFWGQTGEAVVTSSLFVANWALAAGEGGYFLGLGFEPLRHFWSLSVEEQFYLIWPALLIAVAALARNRALRPRLLAVLALIFTGSLAWSLALTAVDPARAYYVTGTRVWELALGGLLAIVVAQGGEVRAELRRPLVVLGVGIILLSGLGFAVTAAFPGPGALLPTLGAAIVILAGTGSSRSFLGCGPMPAIGRLSYSLYLWHWPFVAIAPTVFPGTGGWLLPVAVLVSAVPAWASHRWLEDPIRRSWRLVTAPGRTLVMGLGLIGLSVVVGSGLVWLGSVQRTHAFDAVEHADAPGALVMTGDVEWVPTGQPVPAPIAAVADLAGESDCATSWAGDETRSCHFGDPDHENEVVLLGDSHAHHWLPAFQGLAEAGDFHLRTMIKHSCAVEDVDVISPFARDVNESCSAWSARARLDLLQSPPDHLVLVESAHYIVLGDGDWASRAESRAIRAEALRSLVAELTHAGVQVYVLVDTPYFFGIGSVPECIALRGAEGCSVDRADVFADPSVTDLLAAELPTGVRIIDMTDAFCTEWECPVVIGGVLAYRDSDHFTRTFALTLQHPLREALREAGALP